MKTFLLFLIISVPVKVLAGECTDFSGKYYYQLKDGNRTTTVMTISQTGCEKVEIEDKDLKSGDVGDYVFTRYGIEAKVSSQKFLDGGCHYSGFITSNAIVSHFYCDKIFSIPIASSIVLMMNDQGDLEDVNGSGNVWKRLSN